MKTQMVFMIGLFLIIFNGNLFSEEAAKPANEWWNVSYPGALTNASQTNMSVIQVDGNRFVNEAGETMVFKGLNIADPDKLVKTGKWSKKHFETVKAWGANVVRIPTHPAAWRERGPDDYLKLLDDAVQWCTELEIYIVLDWHIIGNLRTEVFFNKMYDTTLKETLIFWKTVATRYKEYPAVAFADIFNEATDFNNQLGSLSWSEMKTIAEEIITVVQANNPNLIALVSGPNWGYDLQPIKDSPVEKDNIAYVSHPYPQKVEKPWEAKWEADWGFAAEKYPVMCTEFGWMSADERGAHIPVIDDGEYGPAIIDFFDKKGISWTAWCFDVDWTPNLIQDWDYTPTKSGAFFREVLQGRFEPEK